MIVQTRMIKTNTDLLPGIRSNSEYTEEHMHHKTRWYGKRNPQTATQWAASMSTNLANIYRAISGNGVYGTDPNDEAQLFGTADTLSEIGPGL